jgi:hypothetical protein
VLYSVFQAIALFNADQCEEAMLLIKELAAVCPNTDAPARRVIEVCSMWLYFILKPDLCHSHIRHIYVFSSELKPWVTRATMTLQITSLSLSTQALSHRNSSIRHTMT